MIWLHYIHYTKNLIGKKADNMYINQIPNLAKVVIIIYKQEILKNLTLIFHTITQLCIFMSLNNVTKN